MSAHTLKPAIFLDRDGVIVENRADYVKSIDEVHILPGALEGLAQAARLDCRIVVVTNQSVVGRGLLTEPALLAIHAAIHATIVAAGGRIDAWYFCPHLPEAGCACRKPRPGMLLSSTWPVMTSCMRRRRVFDNPPARVVFVISFLTWLSNNDSTG